MKQLDENVALKRLQGKANIDYATHSIKVSKDSNIGLKLLGVIDYLCKVFKWRVFRTSETVKNNKSEDNESKKNYRKVKKENKAPKLTDKTKRKSIKQ